VLVSAFVAARGEPTVLDTKVLEAYAKRRKKDPSAPLAAASAAALDTLARSLRPASSDDYGAQASAARRTLFAAAFAAGAPSPSPALLGSAFNSVAEQVFMPFFASLGGGK
jgi:hypothetical protein